MKVRSPPSKRGKMSTDGRYVEEKFSEAKQVKLGEIYSYVFAVLFFFFLKYTAAVGSRFKSCYVGEITSSFLLPHLVLLFFTFSLCASSLCHNFSRGDVLSTRSFDQEVTTNPLKFQCFRPLLLGSVLTF